MDRGLEQRIRNLLGMAQRAGRIVSGSFAVEQAARDGKAKYLLIAEDAEESSKKKYKELADRCHLPCRTALTREQLGACLGKGDRAAAALLDDGFSSALDRLFPEEGTAETESMGVDP